MHYVYNTQNRCGASVQMSKTQNSVVFISNDTTKYEMTTHGVFRENLFQEHTNLVLTKLYNALSVYI